MVNSGNKKGTDSNIYFLKGADGTSALNVNEENNHADKLNVELNSYRQELSSSLEGQNMNNDDFLSKYIEKIDHDQSDLREDIRESERRTSTKLESIEERMDKRLDRIEDMINGQGSKIDNTMGWIIAVCVATILGIAGLVITILLTLSKK